MATMSWAERGIKVAQQETARQIEDEQRAIVAARFISGHYGAKQDDLAKGLMVAQGWGFGYATRSIHLAIQAKMVGYLECSEVGCRNNASRQSVTLHRHMATV